MNEPTLSRYYRAALQLHEAIMQNRGDDRFGSDRANTIVYLFDTNVVEFYLRTTEHDREGFITFGELFKDQTAVRVGHRLTTEYLLSGDLPGQRGSQVFLSSFHWNETLNRVKKLEQMVQRTASDPVSKLNGLQGLTNAHKLLRSASRIMPKEILKVLSRAEAVERRLRRCFLANEARLRPIEMTSHWENAHARVRHRDVRRWQSELGKLRMAGGGRTGRSTSGLSEQRLRERQHSQIVQDASTLAAIEALYRENPDACGDGRTLSFLFVTADQAILDAVAARAPALAQEGIPLFVRHPRVYSPILNFSKMMQVVSANVELPESLQGVFLEVERAIQQLFEMEDSEDIIERVAPEGPLRKNIARWEDAARKLVTMNSKFFAEDDAAIDAVAERLMRPDALGAASSVLRTTIERIRYDHAHLLSDRALSHLSRNLNAFAEGRAPQGVRRAPVKIVGVDLVPHHSRFRGRGETTQSLDELLDTLLAENNRTDAIRQAIDGLRERLHQEWKSATGQLLAACVYLSIGAWQSARDCAQRSISYVSRNVHKHPSVLWREANYAKALALRFGIKSKGDFDDALRSLDKNLRNWALQRRGGARIASVRDSIELAALLQGVAVLQAIEDITLFAAFGPDGFPLEILDPGEVIQFFDESVVTMEGAAEILEDEFSGATDAPYLVEQLNRQLYLNMVGAYVFRYILGRNLSIHPFEIKDLSAAMERLDELLRSSTRKVPAIGRVYQACGLQILEPSPEAALATLELVDEVIVDDLLPYADIVELTYLRDYFLRPAAGTDAEQPGGAGVRDQS